MIGFGNSPIIKTQNVELLVKPTGATDGRHPASAALGKTMRHILSSTDATHVPPVLFGLRAYSPPSPKTKKPFEAIDSGETRSVSQQQLQQEINTANTLKIYEPPDTEVLTAQTSQEEAETLLMPDFSGGSNLFNKTRSMIDGYPITLPFTGKASSPSLDQSGSAPSTGDDPGRIVNVLG